MSQFDDIKAEDNPYNGMPTMWKRTTLFCLATATSVDIVIGTDTCYPATLNPNTPILLRELYMSKDLV